jgi:hypothetical protein
MEPGRTRLAVSPAIAEGGYDAVSFEPCAKGNNDWAITYFQ